MLVIFYVSLSTIFKDKSTPEEYAEKFAAYLIKEGEDITYSERSEGFRIDINFKELPKEIADAGKKCCRPMSTTLGNGLIKIA